MSAKLGDLQLAYREL